MTTDDRIADLEISQMHLERTLQELHEVVYRQQQEIETLTRELKRLKEQAAVQAEPVTGEEPPPPHY